MSDAGDRLRQRFSRLTVRVLAPELEGVVEPDSRGDVAIYATPFTLKDSQRLQRWIERDDPEGFARIVLNKACDELGNRVFDAADIGALMECVEAAVIKRIGTELGASVTLEEAEGNSSATLSSVPVTGSRTN